MELRRKSIACLLGAGWLVAVAPQVAVAQEEFPALERHYTVDGLRDRKPPPRRWSTVVQHPRHTFFAWGHRSIGESTGAALAQCKRHMQEEGDQCQVALSFTQCAAQARAYHGPQTTQSEGPTLAEVQRAALESCRQQSDEACRLDWSYCVDGTGQVFADERLWGAVARPLDGGGEAVLVTGLKERSTAPIEANWHCEQVHKRPCESVFEFTQCGVYAESADQEHFGWSRSADLAEAEQEATASCNRSAGSLCEVALSHCH